MICPVQSRCHEGSPVGKRSLRWEGFVEKVGFEPGVMDDESGDNRDDLTSEWGGESRHDWRGWRKESGSWSQRRGDAYRMSDLWFSMRRWLVGEKGDNRWGAGTARGLNRDQIVKIARLTRCKKLKVRRLLCWLRDVVVDHLAECWIRQTSDS